MIILIFEQTGKTEATGSTIHFKPSPEVFAITEFKYDILANRVRELSFLNSGVHIEIEEIATGYCKKVLQLFSETH
jgi:DNA gyrase subunit B